MPFLHSSRRPDPDYSALEGALPPLEGEPLPDPDELQLPFTELLPSVQASAPGDTDAVQETPLRRAGELNRLGRRREAVSILTQALTDDPSDVAVRVELAGLQEAGGDIDEAEELLNSGMRIAPHLPPLLIARGALLARHGRAGEGERDLRRGVALAPDAAAGHLELGAALLRQGRPREAIEPLRKAGALDPASIDAVFHLGEAYLHTADLQRALTTLQQAEQMRPEARTLSLLGRLLDRMGRTDEAMVMHRRARDAGAGKA